MVNLKVYTEWIETVDNWSWFNAFAQFEMKYSS